MKRSGHHKYVFPAAVAAALPLAAALVVLPFLGEPGLADPKTATGTGLWIGFLGTLHPLLLHLPIGAFLLVMLLEFLGLISRGRYEPRTVVPLIFTVLTGFLALVFGYCLYLTGSYSGELVEKHKTGALIFCGLTLVCLLLKVAALQYGDRVKKLDLWYLLSLLVCGGVMTAAGHLGGEITHGNPLEKLPSKILAERKAASEALLRDPVVFQHVIQPILEERCVYCHGAEKQEGGYRMDSYAALLTPGDEATGLVPGSVEASAIVSRMHLPMQDKHHMPPPDKPQLTAGEMTLVEWWIAQGAPDLKRKSELAVTRAAEEALAGLVSPAERKALEAERKRKEKEARILLAAQRKELHPAWLAFEQVYPGALMYVSSDTMDMRFTAVSFLNEFGEAGLEKLLAFKDHLVGADFTLSDLNNEDAGLIAGLTSLRRLNVSQTGITDAFVEGLTALEKLEMLNLYGTRVTPAVADFIERIPSLKTLYIGDTGLDAEQTAALRKQLTSTGGVDVRVIGVDQMPDIRMFTPEGAFARKLQKHPEQYGDSIAGRAVVTLSSADLRYQPRGGLADFTAEQPHDKEFVFHSAHEKRPWVQLSFEGSVRVSGFILKNRGTLPHRAEGLELERQLPDGSWESIWKAESADAIMTADLTSLAPEKREAAALRFIINKDEPAMLHLAHLSLWGKTLEMPEPAPADAGPALDSTGQGELTYVVSPGWGAVPGQEHIGSTHGGIVVDRAGNVYVSTDGPNGIIVYRKDGTYLTSIAKGMGRYHGMTINREEGEEFIYAADNRHIAKYRLNGDRVLLIEGETQAEGNTWKRGTAVAVAPDGSIFVADGYGSCVIFKYDSKGTFLKKFGARGRENGQFITSHGLAVDNRNPEQPVLIVCDRESRRLQLLDLEGNFIRVAATGLRRPCSLSLWKDYLLVAELAGRAVILDRDFKEISVLGDNPVPEQHANFHVHPDAWKPGVFTAPHGCSFDHEGNLYVQDWNKFGRVTKLLLRSRLTAGDIAALESLKARAESPGGGVPGWTPDALANLGLWLDADDARTISAVSGRVSQWDDKSPRGYHAYALSPAEHPKSGGRTINGRSVLEFRESRLVRKLPEKGNWQDLYIVADWDGGARFDNYNGLFTGFQGGIGVIGNTRGTGTGLWVHEKWWSSLYVNGVADNGLDVMERFSRPFLVSCSADKAVDVAGFSIGNDRGIGLAQNHLRDWEGAVCEIVAFERKLSDTERQQVEGYLAHKWGLSSALPADHPYKTEAP